MFSEGFLLLLIALFLFSGFLLVPLTWLVKKARKSAKKTSLQKVVDALLLPINFGALFLENRRIEQLPAYYRYFLRFTKFTSRIQYFHFLPKALIAFLAEGLIMLATRQDVLTAIIFLWSVLFLVFITFVESRFGEIEEETITFANKLFLYTVSLLSLIILGGYFFFWGVFEPYFNNSFFHFIGEISHLMNLYILQGFLWFWNSSLMTKFFVFLLLFIYITTAVFYSRYKERKK